MVWVLPAPHPPVRVALLDNNTPYKSIGDHNMK